MTENVCAKLEIEFLGSELVDWWNYHSSACNQRVQFGLSPTIRKSVRQRHSSWGLEAILEEFLGGFLCGVQVAQVELVEDGFLQEKLFTRFPSDTCVPPVTMKSLPERSGIPSTDHSGVGGIELSEECAEGRHGRMVEGEKGETVFPSNKRVFCKMTDSGLHRIKERSPAFRLTAYASTATPQYVDASTIHVSPGLLFTPEPLKSPQRSCRPRPEKRQGWRSLRAGST